MPSTPPVLSTAAFFVSEVNMSAANPRYANGHRRRNLRTRVLREENDCGICGDPVDKAIPTPDPMSPEVDEIIPISLGGDPLDRSNVQLAHRVCNTCKSQGQHRGFCPWCIANGTRMPTAATSYVTSRAW
jgi:5-methylcytosine-specific restriction endonuclease McrA